MKTITIQNTKYELIQHDNGKLLSEIKIKKGWRLLKPWEAQRLWDLGYLRNNWIFVENTNKESSKDYVARFDAYDDRAFLDVDRLPSYRYFDLGVIFAKDLEGGK